MCIFVVLTTQQQYIQSVEPIISTDIALKQFNNTTEDFVKARGYSPLAEFISSGIPAIFVIGIIIYFTIITFVKQNNKESKDESN